MFAHHFIAPEPIAYVTIKDVKAIKVIKKIQNTIKQPEFKYMQPVGEKFIQYIRSRATYFCRYSILDLFDNGSWLKKRLEFIDDIFQTLKNHDRVRLAFLLGDYANEAFNTGKSRRLYSRIKLFSLTLDEHDKSQKRAEADTMRCNLFYQRNQFVNCVILNQTNPDGTINSLGL